jgi:hypothetical protein
MIHVKANSRFKVVRVGLGRFFYLWAYMSFTGKQPAREADLHFPPYRNYVVKPKSNCVDNYNFMISFFTFVG